MLPLITATISLIILLISAALLAAAIYHLFQYQIPGQNYKKPMATIVVLFLVFALVGGWMFLGLPWDMI